jgi:hypothetical protein
MPGPPRRSRLQVLFKWLIEIEALLLGAAAELEVPVDAELPLELLEVRQR